MSNRIARVIEAKWYYHEGSGSGVVAKQVNPRDLSVLERPDHEQDEAEVAPVSVQIRIAIRAHLFQVEVMGLTIAESQRLGADMTKSKWATVSFAKAIPVEKVTRELPSHELTLEKEGSMLTFEIEGQIYPVSECEPIARS
jgi:hypothetical protein